MCIQIKIPNTKHSRLVLWHKQVQKLPNSEPDMGLHLSNTMVVSVLILGKTKDCINDALALHYQAVARQLWVMGSLEQLVYTLQLVTRSVLDQYQCSEQISSLSRW